MPIMKDFFVRVKSLAVIVGGTLDSVQKMALLSRVESVRSIVFCGDML